MYDDTILKQVGQYVPVFKRDADAPVRTTPILPSGHFTCLDCGSPPLDPHRTYVTSQFSVFNDNGTHLGLFVWSPNDAWWTTDLERQHLARGIRERQRGEWTYFEPPDLLGDPDESAVWVRAVWDIRRGRWIHRSKIINFFDVLQQLPEEEDEDGGVYIPEVGCYSIKGPVDGTYYDPNRENSLFGWAARDYGQRIRVSPVVDLRTIEGHLAGRTTADRWVRI